MVPQPPPVDGSTSPRRSPRWAGQDEQLSPRIRRGRSRNDTRDAAEAEATAAGQQTTNPPGQQSPPSPVDSTVTLVLGEDHFEHPGGLDVGAEALAMFNRCGDDTASVLAAAQ